jgi:hypothetical protein
VNDEFIKEWLPIWLLALIAGLLFSIGVNLRAILVILRLRP